MLTVVQNVLTERGIQFVRYDGSLSRAEKNRVLTEFKTETTTKVCLMSLKCGNMGLNITYASRVVMIDPWWNPQVLKQAYGRCHRIGQKKEVHVYRLFIKDAVEARILKIQGEKENVADAAFGAAALNAKKSNRLSVGDLSRLMGL